MSGMTGAHLQAILVRAPLPWPRVFCETGTFRGERAALALDFFREVHTVELSARLHAAAVERWAGSGIHFVLGDSRAVVPQWAAQFSEPVCWYLDAHWFSLNPRQSQSGAARDIDAAIAGADAPLPLWDELAAVADRRARDIVIVDDVRDFGTERPVPAWREVSLERIASYFPAAESAFVLGDQAVVIR